MRILMCTFAFLIALFSNTESARAQNEVLIFTDAGGGQTNLSAINALTGATRTIVANVDPAAIAARYDPVARNVSVRVEGGAGPGPRRLDTYNVDTGVLLSSQIEPAPLAGGRAAAFYELPPDNTAQVASLSNGVNTNSTRIDSLTSKVRALDNKIDVVGALAAALEIERPIEGKTFRLGADVGFFGTETALGVSFSAIKGSVDFGGGIAFASNERMGKASVGLNW